MNLPYECWCESKVAAVVNRFGRFLRSDGSSRDLLDFNFYKCQVAVDDPADILENLFLTLGEVIVAVRVVLVSTAPLGGGTIGGPLSREGTPTKEGTKPTRWVYNWRAGTTITPTTLATVYRGLAARPTVVTRGTSLNFGIVGDSGALRRRRRAERRRLR